MDKPTCRICNTKHYGTEPHKFPDIINEQRTATKEPIETTKEVVEKNEPSAKFDRVAYQRDYMRRRRAKK